eukprot:NODE_24421_length_625_cov_10.817269.p1 GENE.NODE_24421_length_625_cov_10.817269~~NODE_24421_length_625_cov_10.817269.p1  ORF type:complete len:174 (+),score=40.90 NODE_24421_length_625_cov_10.817269:42-524(+)
MVGIVSVALNPEDVRPVWHMRSASLTFYAGVASGAVHVALSRHRGLSIKGIMVLAAMSFLSLFMMTFSSEIFGDANIRPDEIWGTAWRPYCEGTSGLHSKLTPNIAAVFEWGLLASIMGLVTMLLFRDLRGWPRQPPGLYMAELPLSSDVMLIDAVADSA